MKNFIEKVKEKIGIKPDSKSVMIMKGLNKRAKKIPLVVNIAKKLKVKPGVVLATIFGILLTLIFLKYGLVLVESIILLFYPSLKSIEAIEGKNVKTPKHKEP